MRNIVRVFHATAKPGMGGPFRTFFLQEAVPMIRRQEGLVRVQVGLPLEDEGRQYCMITTWTNLEALQGFAGEGWREAVVDPREEHLLEAVSVDHFYEGHFERTDSSD